MHMADALLTPVVGGAFWGVTVATVVYCSNKVKKDSDDSAIPLMGVLGAFIFAAQMINFTIPVTGSSGHLGGGLLLAILLGPAAAFLTIASVLVVQALFFADGGLLALGCNVFNLGFIPAFLVYPLVFKPLAGSAASRRRLLLAVVLSAVVAMQLGSFGVVLQTTWSAVSALPFSSFVLLMQPIHLAIGLVEGLVTAVVIQLVWKNQPELLSLQYSAGIRKPRGRRNAAIAFLLAAMVIGGILSWYASPNPDGLEWSIAQVAGDEGLPPAGTFPGALLETVQQATSILPDYELRITTDAADRQWLQRAGASLSGLFGGGILLVLGVLFAWIMKKRHD